MHQPKTNQKYTYQDYLQWNDDERWELIDGIPYNMTPAPGFYHQSIAGNMYHVLKLALKGKECLPMIAPYDVVLSDEYVVQPDVFVICDQGKITKMNILGAPDMVFEVLSPSTTKKDRWIKKNAYEMHGVKEYIIADPEAGYIERYFLGDDGQYDKEEYFESSEIVSFKSLPDITIPLPEVFETSVKLSED